MDVAHLIHSYGYVALALGTLLEGETLLVAAGVAARQGYLDPLLVLSVAAICGFLGDQFWFGVGRRSGTWLQRRLPWIAAATGRIDRLVRRYDLLAVPAVRFLYGLRIAGPIVIGMGGIDWRRFLVLNLAGAVVWATLVGGAGFFGAGVVEHVLEASPRYQVAVLIGGASIALLLHLLRARHKRRLA